MSEMLYILKAVGSPLHAVAVDKAGSFVRELPAEKIAAFTTRTDVSDQLQQQGYCYIAPSELMARLT